MFNMWLDYDQNWTQTNLAVERIHQIKNRAKTGMIAVKGRQLRLEYSDEKADQIIKNRRESGLWYADADFPDDQEEICHA